MKIVEIHKKVLSVLPQRMHYPIKICTSEKDLFRQLVIRDKLHVDFLDVRKEYRKWHKTKRYTSEDEYADVLMENYSVSKHKPRTCFTEALSGNPILLNRYLLDKESPLYIASVILHEIAHNLGKMKEQTANRFALQWIKEVEKCL